MNKFKNFTLKQPFLFGVMLIILYSLLMTLAYPVHFMFPRSEVGQLYGDTVAKFIVFLVFLFVLWRFGWIPVSGISSLGKFKFWPVILGLLIYRVLTEMYAFSGSVTITFPNPGLAFAQWLLALSTALVEETMVRGLVLTAMILTWGNTKQGQLKAILFSSMLFGIMHLFNIMIRPVGMVLAQALILTIPGIFYAALVITYRSLWPAIVIHWLGNAAVNIKLIGNENYQETFTMWILYAISLIPILAYSAYLIRGLVQNHDARILEVDKTQEEWKEPMILIN